MQQNCFSFNFFPFCIFFPLTFPFYVSSSFPRIHFNFLWQLQRSPIVVEMLNRKLPAKEGSSVSPENLPSIDNSPTQLTDRTNASSGVSTLERTNASAVSTDSTLAQLSVTCLRFNIEVLARARASGCVHVVSTTYLLLPPPALVGRSVRSTRENYFEREEAAPKCDIYYFVASLFSCNISVP